MVETSKEKEMSAEEKKEEASIMGPKVTEPQIVDVPTTEDGNVVDEEIAFANSDGGSIASIAPSVDGVSDAEGISIVEKLAAETEEVSEKKFLFPKIFVKEEELVDIQVEIIFNPSDGDIYSITQPGLLNTDILSTLDVVTYTYKFRPVSYDDMQKYRRQASAYDANRNELIVNRLQLRNFFLINHLRETDMVDENGQPFKLEIDEESNNLSLDSISKIFQTTPALMDVVMTLFERKLLLMFQVAQ